MIAVIAPQSARPSCCRSQSVAHDERTEVRVAEPERAEDVGVLRDFLDRVARVIDHDFLRGDEDAHGRLESFDIELAVRGLELHQVQRGQIAGGVIEEEIFRARVGGILRPVPLQVCHLWIVESNCIPGSPQMHACLRRFCAAACARLCSRIGLPSSRGASTIRPSSAASMNSSLTRTLRFSF